MQSREKILAAALAAVVVLWFGLPIFESVFVTPLNDLEGRETFLQDEVDRLSQKRLELARADKDIRDWKEQSLPSDPLNAQRVYLEWLTDLAQLSGFRNAKITSPTTGGFHRTGPFSVISIKVEGSATFQQLQQFVDRFQEVNLLHRIASCDAQSNDTSGNPVLKIDVQAEGLALRDAPPRNRLFPQTELAGPLSVDAVKLTVKNIAGFPKAAPFRVRLDDEFVEVTAMKGDQWTVRRGVVGTFAQAHAGDVAVELVPLKTSETGPPKFLAATAFFAKPSPPVVYEPKLAQTIPPPVIRGTTWTWKPEVKGWDPLDPDPTFELAGAPNGMTIDSRTGEMNWTPPDDAADGTYPTPLTVFAGGKERLKSTLSIRLRPPNNPPKIEPTDRLTFYFGRESTARFKVTDADLPRQQLSFSLEGAPAGMAIDPRSGVIRWNPPYELEQQSMSVTVKVTDDDELPLVDSITVPIRIEEDSAKYTHLTGCVKHSDGRREATLRDFATNKVDALSIGSVVQVADIELKVLDIGRSEILVEREGKPYRLELGDPVIELTPVPATGGNPTSAIPAKTGNPVSGESVDPPQTGTAPQAPDSSGPASGNDEDPTE